jgi:hypothetical protein
MEEAKIRLNSQILRQKLVVDLQNQYVLSFHDEKCSRPFQILSLEQVLENRNNIDFQVFRSE